jgi:large subunit ribosomal protein L34
VNNNTNQWNNLFPSFTPIHNNPRPIICTNNHPHRSHNNNIVSNVIASYNAIQPIDLPCEQYQNPLIINHSNPLNTIPQPISLDLPLIDEDSINPAEDNTLYCVVVRTYRPNVKKRKRKHGFLSRIRTAGGRRVIQRRKGKGRWRLTA